MRLPNGGRGCACSTPAAAPAPPPRRCCRWPRTPRSSRSTRRRACWPRPRPKRWPATVRFVHSRIEDLADAGVDGPFDGIFAAYLLRNLADPDAQLQTFRTLLRPGATLAVHEYSVRDSRLATAMWNAVCATIIIPVGRLRSGDAGLYRYLWRSVHDFDGAGGVPKPAADQRLHRRAQRDDAGLAAQHRAHLPRGGAAMTDSAARQPPRAATACPTPARWRPRRTSSWSVAASPGLAAATGLAERGVDRRRRRARGLPRRPGRRLDRDAADDGTDRAR